VKPNGNKCKQTFSVNVVWFVYVRVCESRLD